MGHIRPVKKAIIRFDNAEVKQVVLQAREHQCSIVLANDHGIYLMADVFEKIPEYVGKIAIAYADGCNPNLNSDYRENVRESMGHSYEEYKWDFNDKNFDDRISQSSGMKLLVTKTTIRFI